MSFLTDLPDYATYVDGDRLYTKLPRSINSPISGLISRLSSHQMKYVCDELAGRIPTAPTTNWGSSFLINDVDGFLTQLSNRKLPKYMDFLMWMATDGEVVEVSELNEVLDEEGLGYELVLDRHTPPHWKVSGSKLPSVSAPLLTAKTSVKDICEQAAAHLSQAVEHLKSADDDRSRKDALRDSLSAMESVIKKLSGNKEITDGVKDLRNNNFGNDTILREGTSLWNQMHNLYPDVRHGNPTISELSKSDALYWIERIAAYVSYLHRQHREVA